MGHLGSSPEPFDALDGAKLAGPEGSHPLHHVHAEDLLRESSGDVRLRVTLDRPVLVGEGVTGSLALTAVKTVHARDAHLRLVGLRLMEYRKSETRKVRERWETDSWVEANGDLFLAESFLEPRIPVDLDPGATFESRFAVPTPDLGPPSAHLGEAIVAWGLEVRWDVARSADPFAASLLPIAQHPDLIRAGVGKQGGLALLQSVSPDADRGATITVESPLPASPGSDVVVRPRWPAAPKGRAARVELWVHASSPNATGAVLARATVPVDAVRDGSGAATLPLHGDAAPSFDGAGLELRYSIRVVVDVPMRPDATIERDISVA